SFGPDFQVRDTDSDPNPARPLLTGQTVVITNSGPEELEAITMNATGSQPAGKDFHTGFDNDLPESEDFPISVNVELEKVGRGGEGGDLVIGGKSQSDIGKGIEQFDVKVLGDESKPSNLGMMTSTNAALHTVNIVTGEEFVDGETHASLTVRDGFRDNEDLKGDDEDLKTVDASEFLGDLMLGNDTPILNLDTLIATGGGDVSFYGNLDGQEPGQAYSYMTGEGDDVVDLELSGDALDYAGSSIDVSTGAGDDDINIAFAPDQSGFQSEQLNQTILDGVTVEGGSGDDNITVNGVGNANINGGDGNDVIITAGAPVNALSENEGVVSSTAGNPATNAVWAFNFDAESAETGGIGSFAADELPGEQTSLAYIGGATVTVTLSGAGGGNSGLGLAAGGGVMADDGFPGPQGAWAGENGYENSFTITSLLSGNRFYGDQRDVNAAVMEAINDDPVLGELLTASMGPDNTLIVVSNTSGAFGPGDLRIEIDQADQDDWSSVEAEAQSLFSDSGITVASAADADAAAGNDLSDSDGTDAWYDGLSAEGDNGDGGQATRPNVGEGESNLHTEGMVSDKETDNVINGGNDDDLIVLSTDAIAGPVQAHTHSSKNALLNGASNETIVMEGRDFGNDTIMNFTTSGPREEELFRTPTRNEASVEVIQQGDTEEPTPEEPATEASFVLRVTGADANAPDDFEIELDYNNVVGTSSPIASGAPLADVKQALVDGFAGAGDGWVVTDNGDDTVTFTAETAGELPASVNLGNFTGLGNLNGVSEIIDQDIGSDLVPAGTTGTNLPEIIEFTFQDADVDGTYTFNGQTVVVEAGDTGAQIAEAFFLGNDFADWNPTGINGNTVTLTATSDGTGGTEEFGDRPDVTIDQVVGTNIEGEPVTVETINDGLDFLDFTAYLTSETDVSTGTPDSNDSEVVIPVTLNTNSGPADPNLIGANEVTIVTYDDDPNETGDFDSLSASDIEGLFDGDDFDGGALDAGDFDVIDGQSDDLVVDGNGKAILMVENADNEGEYKVFELSWDASADDGDENVSAEELGSLDFGDSLDGLENVNLVGSEDRANLDLSASDYGIF
ncbi:MAG: hypothetical protein LC687_01135, partial [Actinobacteria bacterium]|nr:hypothetical protein [Actinomycetota bacterium]